MIEVVRIQSIQYYIQTGWTLLLLLPTYPLFTDCCVACYYWMGGLVLFFFCFSN